MHIRTRETRTVTPAPFLQASRRSQRQGSNTALTNCDSLSGLHSSSLRAIVHNSLHREAPLISVGIQVCSKFSVGSFDAAIVNVGPVKAPHDLQELHDNPEGPNTSSSRNCGLKIMATTALGLVIP